MNLNRLSHAHRSKLKQEMAKLLRNGRLELKLSRKELSDILCITEATIGNWEKGDLNVELIIVLKILRIDLALLDCKEIIDSNPKLSFHQKEGLVDIGRGLMGTDNSGKPEL